ASLDPNKTKSTVLISIPRDVYFLGTEKMGKGKINSFYRDYKSYLKFNEGLESEEASIEAIRELKNEIGRKLGLEMHHAVKINFTAFTEAVDALGGIDIEVPETIVDTEYPNNEYGYETFEIREGPNHLDGETALKYARSRHSTSDFSRSARQQQLISAIGRKAKEGGGISNPSFITSMLTNLSSNVESTMTLRELIGLAEMGKKLNKDNIISIQLNDRNALYDGFVEPGGFLYTPPRDLFGGAAVLLPVSIPEFPVTWKRPKTLVTLLMHARKIYLNKPKISILNNGAKSGTARILATELIRYGFEIDEIANAKLPEKQESSILFTQNEELKAIVTIFEDLLHVSNSSIPEGLPIEQTRDITIILGKNYNYKPLQYILSNKDSLKNN
ncbi:MAG: LCP family protein, partial [Candidatus Peribacteraceae bacterium]|nr:LCP family protein [Candidatus Peribacteraceae bacterium]